MFNRDFFPTSFETLDFVLSGVDFQNRVCMDPSAGSGNIVDYLLRNGAKEVLCCEIEPDLARIVRSKGKLIASDFLTVKKEDISHVECIVMNPPFSADEQHILHAWEIAPSGCTIVALCNYETYRNSYSYKRKCLKNIIEEYGCIENIGDVFSTASRKTNVNIGFIKLFKPKEEDEFEFEGYFDLEEEGDFQENAIMPFNEIRDVVHRYVGALKMFNKVMEANESINSVIAPISRGLGVSFGAISHRREISSSIDRKTFKKELQKSAWMSVFDKLKMDKYLTQSVISDLNKFVEQQTHVPFTMRNIDLMVQMVVGTHQNRLEKVLVEAFEDICSFSHKNSTAKEGWKTNSDYKINRRFIKPYVCDHDMRWPSDYVKISSASSSRFDDIVKALCLITGQRYEDQISLSNFFQYPFRLRNEEGKFLSGYDYLCYRYSDAERVQERLRENGIKVEIVETQTLWGQWVECGFFRVKGHKKGTMHFEFIDEKVWEKFNLEVAKIKGWRLPKETDRKTKGTERTRNKSMHPILFAP